GTIVHIVEHNQRQRGALVRVLRAAGAETYAVDPAHVDELLGKPRPRILVIDAEASSAKVAAAAAHLDAGRAGGPEGIVPACAGGPHHPELDRLQGVTRLAKPIAAAQLVETLMAMVHGAPIVEIAGEVSAKLRTRHRRRILLAEDNPVNRKVARGFLERAGH